MTTILVWVALIYSGDYRGGFAVIDGIATKEECQRIIDRAQLIDRYGTVKGNCTQYRKVIAK